MGVWERLIPFRQPRPDVDEEDLITVARGYLTGVVEHTKKEEYGEAQVCYDNLRTLVLKYGIEFARKVNRAAFDLWQEEYKSGEGEWPLERGSCRLQYVMRDLIGEVKDGLQQEHPYLGEGGGFLL